MIRPDELPTPETVLETLFPTSSAHGKEVRFVGADIADALEAENAALRAEVERLREVHEAAIALVEIVEGLRGSVEHGTWRAERSNLRIKDTGEWAGLYVAVNSLKRAALTPPPAPTQEMKR